MKKLMFIALAFVFAISSMNAQAPKDGPRDGGDRMKKRVEQLKSELQLTDEQTKKIEDLFAAQGKAMKELRESGDFNRDKMKDLMKERETKMKEILTPEQQVKFLELNKKERMERGRRERPEGENK